MDRTIDLLVAPTGEIESLPFGEPITGSADQIAELFRSLSDAGVSEIRVAVWPPSPKAVEAMSPVVDLLP